MSGRLREIANDGGADLGGLREPVHNALDRNVGTPGLYLDEPPVGRDGFHLRSILRNAHRTAGIIRIPTAEGQKLNGQAQLGEHLAFVIRMRQDS